MNVASNKIHPKTIILSTFLPKSHILNQLLLELEKPQS